MQPLKNDWSRGWAFWVYLAFAGFCLAVYEPALEGEFVSDDHLYISENLFTAALDLESIGQLFRPFGDAHALIANYAPVHFLGHAFQRQIFGEEVFGYHVTNILLHALNATLLVALLLASRVPPTAALLGGGVFALHPANVEAVAWVSQLKSLVAMALALIALRVHSRWPLASTVPFGLALLAKASAFFALPMLLLLAWVRRGPTRQNHYWGRCTSR